MKKLSVALVSFVLGFSVGACVSFCEDPRVEDAKKKIHDKYDSVNKSLKDFKRDFDNSEFKTKYVKIPVFDTDKEKELELEKKLNRDLYMDYNAKLGQIESLLRGTEDAAKKEL